MASNQNNEHVHKPAIKPRILWPIGQKSYFLCIPRHFWMLGVWMSGVLPFPSHMDLNLEYCTLSTRVGAKFQTLWQSVWYCVLDAPLTGQQKKWRKLGVHHTYTRRRGKLDGKMTKYVLYTQFLLVQSRGYCIFHSTTSGTASRYKLCWCYCQDPHLQTSISSNTFILPTGKVVFLLC